MTILWTNCSERMPPDDPKYEVIYNISEPKCYKGSGHTLHFCIKEFSDPDKLRSLLNWTPYTPEAWAELNRK